MIRRELWRGPAGITGFALELVLAPREVVSWIVGHGALDDDLVAPFTDTAEGAIRVGQPPPVERSIHHLMPRNQVARRPVTQHQHRRGHREYDDDEPRGRRRVLGRLGKDRND